MSPRLLICGFGPFPSAPDNPAGLAVRQLRGEAWAPAGAQAAYALLPTVWAEAPSAALEALDAQAAQGVLLVGVAVSAETFRVEIVARNRVSMLRADASGALWPAAAIDVAGPDRRGVTAPVAAMQAAIAARDLPVVLSDNAGDYLCNFTLYRVLAGAGERPAAFLHVPAVGGRHGLDDIVAAVRAAAQAFADALA